MELVLQIASSAVFYIATYIMFEKMYPKRNIKFLQKLLITFAAAIIMVIVGFIQNPILNFSYSLLSMLVLNKLLYRPRGKSYIVYDTVLLIIMMAIEMLSVSLLSFIINVRVGNIIENPYLLSAAAVLNWILLLAAFKSYIVIVSGKSINTIKNQEFAFFLILLFGETFLLYFINDILVLSRMKYELAILLFVFLAIDLYLEYLLYKISESYELEKNYDLLKQQSLLQLNAYKELNKKYDASRRIIHDVRRHISSLERLINENNVETAMKYKDMLNEQLDRLVPQFSCENSILSVIISNKLSAAEGMNIDLKLNIEFSKLDFISELDITTIFTNLMDNAFEASAELPDDKRFISLTVSRYNCFLLIIQENTYKNVCIDENHKYMTTKSHHQGLGLSNVKNAVETYGGNMEIYTENELFQTKILIPIPENEF